MLLDASSGEWQLGVADASPRPPIRMTHRLTRPALALALLAIAACGDSPTEPRKRADISVELAVPVDYQYVTGADGAALVSCDAFLRAINHGKAAGSLGGIKVYLYAGKDRALPLDSLAIDDAAQAWDDSRLEPGDTTLSHWTLSAAIPFGVTMEFKTSDDHGTLKSPRVSFACGPVPPPSPPPLVSGLTLAMDPSNTPGSVLVVHYAVTAPGKLWRTTIVADGPCHLTFDVYDYGVTEATHDVRIPTPPTCGLGVPFTVSVTALDAGFDQGTASRVSSFVLEDHTPPTLSPVFFSNGSWSGTFGGTYLADDSILVDPRAADGNGLRMITWTMLPSGETDSLSLAGTSSNGQLLRIPIHTSWTGGSRSLRIVARDVAGNEAAVEITSAPLTVVPVVSRASITQFLSGTLRDLVPDARHGRVYVLFPRGVIVLSAATLAPIETIPISLNGASLDLTAGGDTLVVAPYDMDSLAIVDLNAPAATRVHDVQVTTHPGVGQGSGMVMVGADGKAYIIRAFTATDWAVVSHDLASGAEQRIDGTYYLLGRSLDHSVIAVERSVSCSALYPIATSTVSSCAPVTSDPFTGLWGDRTGSRFTAGLRIWDVGSNAVREVALPRATPYAPIYRSVLSPDGAEVYVGVRGHLLHARASDATLLDASRLPDSQVANGPYDIFKIAEDGSFIIAATGVLDTQTIITRIALP